MGIVLLAALAWGTFGDRPVTTAEDRMWAVAETIKCPTCRSQSAADSSVVEPLTQQPWSFVAVLIAATLGAVAGSLAGYLIGAWGGRPLLERVRDPAGRRGDQNVRGRAAQSGRAKGSRLIGGRGLIPQMAVP